MPIITSLIFLKFQMEEILDKLGFGSEGVKARFKEEKVQQAFNIIYMCMLADTTAVIHVLGIK